MNLKNSVFIAFVSLLLFACAPTQQTKKSDDVKAEMKLAKTSFSNLPSWQTEDFIDFKLAYQRSCNRLLKNNSQKSFGKKNDFGKMQEWQIACRKFEKIDQNNSNALRHFFEENFTPYQVAAGTETEGLFTGYYEASLKGSKTRQGPYQYPLRARPDDLVMVNLGEFREELKGQRIAGRVKGGRLKPYETHAEINAGQLPKAQDKTLVWVDSAVDAFFIQIQGSGIVSMDDDSIMRVGYAGQNGHPYYAIGRELIKRGELTKDNVSMQSIRGWLQQNPSKAREIMETNKSYVFFTEIDGEGPVGGEGIALTPMRSLAIDHSIIPYGMPVFISVEHPTQEGQQINRLMMAQDTGGAIRGPVRGDFFWGYGSKAEELAGKMKSQGQYWFLLPKTL
jgi:membrane-bound lytic murein transglycosylase A